MSIAVFFLLAAIVAAVVAYPLLPGKTPPPLPRVVTDRDIERAVRSLRRVPGRGGLACLACGRGYRAGDRFCVQCGAELAGEEVAAAGGVVCPSCGVIVQEGDQFCAKCGHRMQGGEEV